MSTWCNFSCVLHLCITIWFKYYVFLFLLSFLFTISLNSSTVGKLSRDCYHSKHPKIWQHPGSVPGLQITPNVSFDIRGDLALTSKLPFLGPWKASKSVPIYPSRFSLNLPKQEKSVFYLSLWLEIQFSWKDIHTV